MTPPQAVLTIYLATAACGLGAILLHQVNAFGAGVILLLVFCMLCLIAILEATGRRQLRRGRNGRRESPATDRNDAAPAIVPDVSRADSPGKESRSQGT